MTRNFLSAALITAALASPALASGDRIDTETMDKIRISLTEQGYDVRKIEAEGGMYEAYALKDGQRLEIYLDAELNIVRTKTDD